MMLPIVKAMSNAKLVLFAFLGALLILSLAVTASPLDLGDDEVPNQMARAVGGKYVGSSCTSNAECYSENYANGTTTTKLTCQRQPKGGPCFKNSNCVSRNCDTKARTCSAVSNTEGPCRSFGDCNYNQFDITCVSGVCKLKDGSACSKDGQCITGHCINKVCRLLPRAPNADCFDDSECLSGRCVDIPTNECTKPDGSFTFCDYPNNGNAVCSRYDLGHACENDGECDKGLCQSGVCTQGELGDRCTEQYQCGNSTLCGPDGTCYAPKNGTVHPEDRCSDNSQCISGRCVDSRVYKDENGINTSATVDQEPTCDYLKNGQPGCRTYRDCDTGLCLDGTCQAGKDGDRCITNVQCEDICSPDGVCYTLSSQGDQAYNEQCRYNEDCLSNLCFDFYPGYSRPSLDDPSKNVIEPDGHCGQSAKGGKCHSSSDCGQGACSDEGVCTLIPFGGACSAASQCTTQACDTRPNTSTSGTCVTAGEHVSCTSDDQCFSGSCVEVPCYSHGCPYNGGDRGTWCASVPPGQACRFDDDCSFESGTTCSDQGLCAFGVGRYCQADGECLSGHCTDKKCVDAPVSTTTSTSTSSTLATSTSTSASLGSSTKSSATSTSSTSTSASASSTSSTITSTVTSYSKTASSTTTTDDKTTSSTTSTSSSASPTPTSKTASASA